MTTAFINLYCYRCGRTFDARMDHSYCKECSKPLQVSYDLDLIRRKLSPTDLRNRVATLWRYREMLPVFDDRSIVSLHEGWTPIVSPIRLAKKLSLPNLLIKDEGVNPTGSFKARGLCLAISKAKELGITEVAMPSAGNAGGALAAYAASAGIRAHVFVPEDTPIINIKEVSCYGAEVHLVAGTISDAAKNMNECNQGHGWFDISTMKEPYRLEGKKTMGYEIAEQLSWKLPDVIIYPTGGGTGLIGMWKAFKELETLGWISNERPRMVAVQAAGCAPIVKAFKEQKHTAEFWTNAQTVASGLRVPKAFADELILSALAESHGTAVSVTDDELLADMKLAAEIEGILLCPEGAAGISALRYLLKNGFVQEHETVLLFNTGTGYKYLEMMKRITG